MRARAEAAVDRTVGIEQERGEGLVGVELEQVPVQTVRRDEADADELLQQGLQAPVPVDEILVEFDALLTGDAAEDDQQGLACRFRLGESPRQVVVDPESLRFDLFAIRAHFLFAGLGPAEAGHNQAEPQTENGSGHETPGHGMRSFSPRIRATEMANVTPSIIEECILAPEQAFPPRV